MLGLVLLGACGRIGFDHRDDATISGDADPTGDSGPVAPGILVTLSATGQCPAIAWSGDTIGVVWREGPFTGTANVVFEALDLTGAIVQGPLTLGAALDNVWCPAIAWTGNQFLVAIPYGAVNRQDIDIVTINSSGASALMNVVNDSGESVHPKLAVRGTQVVLTWFDQTGTNYNVLARPLSPIGVPTAAAFTVSGLTSANGLPMIAATATGFAVTFANNDGPHFRLLDSTGVPAGAELIVGTTTLANGPVPVASTGSDLLLAWGMLGTSPITTARVDSTGTLLAGPFAFSNSRANVAMIWTGAGAWLLFVDPFPRLAQLSADGQHLSEQLVVYATANYHPTLAWTGAQFIAATDATGGAFCKILAP